MSGNFYTDFLYFIIYSFIGWCCEVVYCSVPKKKFVNRGFLNAPICPIYGFGALIVVVVMTPVGDDAKLIFIGGVFLTSVLEYFTGWAMEKLFKVKWWDYSDKRFNIDGRVCLENTLIFGLLAVILMLFIHPNVCYIVSKLSYTAVQIITVVCLMLLSSDLTLTVQSVLSLNERMEKIKAIKAEIRKELEMRQQLVGEKMSDGIEFIRENAEKYGERLEQLRSEARRLTVDNKFFQRRIIKAYPELKSIRHSKQIEDIRKAIEKRLYKHKKQ